MPSYSNTDISLTELNEVLNSPPASYFLLDVRTDPEFVQGHLPGSVNLPLAELEQRHVELPQDLPIIVVCHAGVRSAHALEILEAKGFRDIRHLPGGLLRLGYL
jgi:phage shock protein E